MSTTRYTIYIFNNCINLDKYQKWIQILCKIFIINIQDEIFLPLGYIIIYYNIA